MRTAWARALRELWDAPLPVQLGTAAVIGAGIAAVVIAR